MGDLGLADYVWDLTPHDNVGGGSITWVIWAWAWLHIVWDPTPHDNIRRSEDRLLIMTLHAKKAELLKKMIAEYFPVRQWKWHMMFDLLQITESVV